MKTLNKQIGSVDLFPDVEAQQLGRWSQDEFELESDYFYLYLHEISLFI